MQDIEDHITFKEMKASRFDIHAILPELKDRRLLHEDNQFFISVLKRITSKSPSTMRELRDQFLLIDTYAIKIHTRYIQSAANA